MRFTSFGNIPIFRRLFLAFFLAVLIPDSLILLTSLFYTQALVAHGMDPAQTSPFTIWTMLALVVSTGVVIVLTPYRVLCKAEALRRGGAERILQA